ncbi:MAG: metallophosphoesterase [Fidelibacterota bacterium]|nr:MAG: metallophosphoesterase [Candidatus Neomarinimicrobiota bacterium]
MSTRGFHTILRLAALMIICSTHCAGPAKPDLVFIAAADWRYKATEDYHTPAYFMGALQSIVEVGKGAFMVSPGDVEPIDASRELISQVLGEEYIWYPVAGNHELDSAAYMESLRTMNAGGNTLPGVVRVGPPGSEETTYSFEWGNCHFVVLNQYFDGHSDVGTDGDVVPELLEWLRRDLSENEKRHIFVIGHEPLISIPDMETGRIRHEDDSLNKYVKNMHRFHQLMLEYGTTAYLCGHTHNTSIAKINGIWQIDVGHARGIEDPFPALLYKETSNRIPAEATEPEAIESGLRAYFEPRKYAIKKVLYYAGLTKGIYYKELQDEPAFEALTHFYATISQNPSQLDEYCDVFWENNRLTASSYTRLVVDDAQVTVEVYRNDAVGGEYSLVLTEVLD